MKLREVIFDNRDATPRKTVLHVGTSSVTYVMRFYGAFYAGDKYAVTVDGEPVSTDVNGELVGELPCV